MSSGERVLVVEDEEIVAGLIHLTLTECGYQVTSLDNAASAWQTLKSEARFDAILLDRGLPDMDGMALLHRIKADQDLCRIPVVIETGQDDSNSVREGLAAGAYYYLTKPLQPPLLLAVLDAAIEQYKQFTETQAAVQEAGRALNFITAGTFQCRTLAHACELAQSLAHAYPDPSRVVFGLQELLINAVEHGNLGISYAEKTKLVIENAWHKEIERREVDPAYCTRHVTVHLERSLAWLKLTIQDEGDGFQWENYLELSPKRAFDPHGRGIAMARKMSFDTLDYLGNGNTVVVTVNLNAPG
ncbi:MAG: response regulator [Magnetococcales bacterium]|nr:response regulator [Magnetococcales bacterium]